MPAGLTVADSLSQLWRYFSLEYELFRGVIGWVPRIASYDVKCALVEHLHEDMRRTRAIRERIADFGVFSPERRIDPGLSNLVRHLLQAPFDGALAGAFYRVLKVEQAGAYRRHLHTTLRLNDAPTVAVLEDHLPKLDRQIAWAKALLEGPALPSSLSLQVEAFEQEIRDHLTALGGIFRPEGKASVTGGSSIAELEASLAGSMSPEDIAELTENARTHASHPVSAASTTAGGRQTTVGSSLDGQTTGGVRDRSAVVGGRSSASSTIPDYPQYVRPRVMALEPRFSRQTAERQHDEPWKEDVLAIAAYTHFTELPVIDICAALVYDGRDIITLGADRGGEETGEEAAPPEDPEEAAKLAEAKEKYARAVQRAQQKRAGGEGLNVIGQGLHAEGQPHVPARGASLGLVVGRRLSAGAKAVPQSSEMPFDYFCDFLRQTWDEVRHSRMGFERLQALGIDPYQVAIPLGHYAVWGNLHLRDRIASLTQVGEACSFKGKREWVAIARDRGEWLSALEHDYDMVDEKNHVRFGARWLPEILHRLGDQRTPEEVVQDVDWMFRRRINAIKRDMGEAWKEVLGNKFLGCGTQTSDVTLAPEIIA
jgi:hypothetical protein